MRLKHLYGDMAIQNGWNIEKLEEEKEKNIAIVGAGPAGITAAAYLVRHGLNVCLYEKHEDIGGLLMHGIPEFRLPKDVVNETIKKVLELGVKVVLGKELGKDLSLDELKRKYDAVLLCFGSNISAKMGIEGEDLIRSLWWK